MLPTVFISHGSPMLAIEPGTYGKTWKSIAASIPRPDAILMVSAHWNSRQPVLSAASNPATIHDFGGFPAELYQIQYPAPGAPVLAERVAGLLETAGFPVGIAPDRGLDHGAWVPLQQMYPEADIPVTQLSVQPAMDAEWHLKMGEALRPLRDENVLVIASGSLTHNLHELHFDEFSTDVADEYVHDFQHWMQSALQRHDRAALASWLQQAPQARRAHPTPEHLLPLFVAYGAAGDQPDVEIQLANYSGRALAMDCYVMQ